MSAAHNGRVPLTTDPQQRRRADSSPYVDLTRAQWSALREKTPLPLTADEVERLRGLGDVIDLDEVRDVYLPLSRLLNLYVGATSNLRGALNTFLGDAGGGHGSQPGTPFVIGVVSSVAVGKSTTARLLQALLARWPEHPRVELVTTDGFLFPNAELHRRGLMSRKGFPESYDRRALTRFVADVKSGRAEVTAPVYSHLIYDIVPGERLTVHRPDILIVEGLNVLRSRRCPARTAAPGSASPTSSTSPSTSTPAPRTSSSGTSAASANCARPPSRTRSRTSASTPRCRKRRRWTTPA